MILRDIILAQKKTFGEFKNSPEGIATNILTARLNLLENYGIILKRQDPENKKVYRYTLTPKGIGLIPLMLEMMLWGAAHSPQKGVPPAMLKFIHDMGKRIKKDKKKFIEELSAPFLKALK